jgi:hypothetical protein
MTESQPRRLRFHIVIDREARQIAQRLKDATQLRVFLLLPSFLRWEAWHPIDEERIAGELKISLTSCEKRSPHSYCTASFCTTIPITVSLSGASRLCGVRRVRGGRCRPISRAKQTGSRTRTAGERTRTRVRGGCHVAPKPPRVRAGANVVPGSCDSTAACTGRPSTRGRGASTRARV